MDRETLARALRASVDVEWIDAAWVGGSEAFGRHDAWSDLDLQLSCAEDRIPDAFALVEAALEALGGVTARWVPAPNPDFVQTFYQLAHLPEWCMLDLCVLRPGRLAPYLDPVRHGTPVVWFDRHGVLMPTPDATLGPVFRARRENLRGRVRLLGHLPAKALARGHWVEAVDTYHRVLLAAYVELLRAEHCPKRQDYGLRYLDTDLPPAQVSALERLAMPTRETLADQIVELRDALDGLLSER